MTAEEQPPQAGGESAAHRKKEGEKKKPEGLVIPPKKPKLTKAERRALQEQQRAAKAAGAGGSGKGNQQQKQQQQQKQGQKSNEGEQKHPKPAGSSPTAGSSGGTKKQHHEDQYEETHEATRGSGGRKTVSLFSHLPPYQNPKDVVETGACLTAVTSGSGGSSYPLHPAVIELGHKYACGQIRGGNARCRAMLRVFFRVIGDFQPPPNASLTDMRQQLDQWVLKPSFQYWTGSCRTHSVTMGNAFTFLKTAVASLERDMSRDAMVEMVQDTIQAYIQERIDYAKKAIAQQPALQLPASHTSSGQQRQVFLTYGHSEAIAAIFTRMATEGSSGPSQFRVIVVDSRPLLEGKKLLRTLRAANIDCSYILLNALSYIMRDVTKVYLGASALMSDGGVLGRVGTACVALSAHMHHIPVLVCCESYKISNRVQLESITGNELGDPTQVAMLGSNKYAGDDEEKDSVLKDWLEMDNLRLLNLLYDLTPSEFVSGIVTELGIIPPTSVAVLLREMNPQN